MNKLTQTYELMYLDHGILPLPEDIINLINNHINSKELKREYFLKWSFKTPETNKILLGDTLYNVNNHIRNLKTDYENSLQGDMNVKPCLYDFIRFIRFNDEIDRDKMCIKVNNKIVCRFFNTKQNRKINRYLKEQGCYALFYKILLKCIICERIKGYRQGCYDIHLNVMEYYAIILHQP